MMAERFDAVLCLDEGVVAGAADGYARMAGRPAATLLHLGPGLGNAWANLHNARRARTPVVNIVGDHATYHGRYDAPLESDIGALAGAVSRWVRRPSRAEDVGPDTAEAVAAAWAPPGGVATLILPAERQLGRRRRAGGRGASALPGRRARRRRGRGRQGVAGRRARRRAARRHGADGCRTAGRVASRRGDGRAGAHPDVRRSAAARRSGGRRSTRSATSPSRPTRSSPVPSTCCSSTARPRWRSSPTPAGRARWCRRDARFTRSARTTRTSSPRWRRWSIRSPRTPCRRSSLPRRSRCCRPTSRSDRATSASPLVRPCRRGRSSSTSRSRRASGWPAARSLRHRTTGWRSSAGRSAKDCRWRRARRWPARTAGWSTCRPTAARCTRSRRCGPRPAGDSTSPP